MGKIENQIPIDLKTAMLAKDKVKLASLRAVKSAFLLEKTKEGFSGTISDDLAQQIISKLHKQRMDAYQIYVDQKREDLSSEEIEQAKVLEVYLPKQLSEEELSEEEFSDEETIVRSPERSKFKKLSLSLHF